MIRRGRNRTVLLTRRYAIKVPTMASWRDFLFGLLNNQNEVRRGSRPGHCPVVAYIPGGWLVVMRRAEPLTDAEWQAFDPTIFPFAEHKPCSFGKLDGKVVCVDYGW